MDYPPPLPGEERAGGVPGGVSDGDVGVEVGDSLPAEAVDRMLPRGGGVYLLTDEQDRLIQLAGTGDLRRTLRARLIEPHPHCQEAGAGPVRRKAHLGQIARKIRWRATHSMFEVDYEYHRIARVLMPDDYLDNVAFGPAWLVHVDPEAKIPRFVAGKKLRQPPGLDLGPFATQADANRFIQILEDAFDLCRHHHILEQVPNGPPCAYFEMGKCPAPCNGSIPMSAYGAMISSAAAFACGRREAACESWQRQMQEAAAGLRYEQAAMLRQRLDRARGIEHAAFRRVRPVEAFNYLVVQRAKGRTRVKPFFVRAGGITPGEQAKLKEIDQVVPGWVGEMRKPPAPPMGRARDDGADRQHLTEQIWLVSHYLFKRDPPGLFMHVSELGDTGALAERVRQRFAQPPREVAGEAAGAPSPREQA